MTLTQDLGRILAALHQVKIKGTSDFVGAIQVAQVRLVKKRNLKTPKEQNRRISNKIVCDSVIVCACVV